MDRKKAEQINRGLQKKLCQTFQTEAAIDLACDQDRVLREHFPQVARSHREEISCRCDVCDGSQDDGRRTVSEQSVQRITSKETAQT